MNADVEKEVARIVTSANSAAKRCMGVMNVRYNKAYAVTRPTAQGRIIKLNGGWWVDGG